MSNDQQPTLLEQAQSIEADLKSTSATIVDLEEKLNEAREKRTRLQATLNGINFGVQLGRRIEAEERDEKPEV